MHYLTNSELPPDLKKELPEEAQDLYRQIFNRNFPSSRREITRESEQIAHQAAWKAVKEKFDHRADQWVKK